MQQQITGFLIPNIQNHVQFTIEEGTIETDVLSNRSFPLGIRVTDTSPVETSNCAGVGTVDVIRRSTDATAVQAELVVGVNVVGVTHDPVTTTDFQIVDPLQVLHELFGRNPPSRREGWEHPVTAVFAKTRRTVATYQTSQDVLVVEIVSHPTEVRSKVHPFAVVTSWRVRRCVRQRNEVWVIGEWVQTTSADAPETTIIQGFLTYQDVNTMYTKLLLIVGSIRNYPTKVKTTTFVVSKGRVVL